MVTCVARTADEVREALAGDRAVRIVGSNTKAGFRLDRPGEDHLELQVGCTGIVEHDVDDQVVVVRAGTSLSELQEELSKRGQTVPMPHATDWGAPVAGFPGTVGGMISMNLPHGLEGPCGNWRDWVLGLQVVLADGLTAQSGSKVVKSVSGYDVHKLFVGARGALGVVLEAGLRTWPLAALPKPNIQRGREWDGGALSIQRTRRSDFCAALEGAGDRVIASDSATSTLWAHCTISELARFEDDWVVGSGPDGGSVGAFNPVAVPRMRRTLELFDPGGRLNAGAMGALG